MNGGSIPPPGIAHATQTNVDGGAARFKQADNDTADANNPIPIPAAGTNYSFIKQFRLAAATTPSNIINNIQFYMDGANGYGTGIGLLVRTSATYTDPTVQGSTALAGAANGFGYTAASPLAVTGSIANPATGLFGHYVQLQLSVDSTATPGSTTGEAATFAYDES